MNDPNSEQSSQSTRCYHETDRRRFFTTTAGGILATTSLASISHGAPADDQVDGLQQATASPGTSTTKRWRIGCIGTGDRWRSIARAASHFADIVALCDVDSAHLREAKMFIGKLQEIVPDGYEDYEKLLQRDDIDAVTITTPDHWHTAIAIAAMRAGKDVYCEKPLTLTVAEGQRIIEVLEQTERVFQVGTQQRSEFEQRFLQAVALCQSGRLGAIERVTCVIGRAPSSPPLPVVTPPETLNWDKWLGPAPFVEYRAADLQRSRLASRCHYEFRWWYETSGGKMTDWGAHHVDIAQWAIGQSDTGPVKIIPKHVVHPVPLDAMGMPTEDSRYNVATEFTVECEFPNGVLMVITSEGKNGIEWVGKSSSLFVSRNELRGEAVDRLENEPLEEDAISRLCKGMVPQGPHAHMGNFFAAVAARHQPISDVYSHHRAVTTCHLANIAIRLGRELRWDPEREQILDDAVASSMLARVSRPEYAVG